MSVPLASINGRREAEPTLVRQRPGLEETPMPP